MNKQIKELAKEAGGYVSLSHEHDSKLILSGEDIVQKFAELIIRKCAHIYWSIDNGEQYDAYVKELKKHFKVK